MAATPYDGRERPIPVLDVLYPYAGPCGFCGFGDKRHRLADALVDHVETPEELVRSFDWPDVVGVAAIETLREYAAESRRRRRHRWEIR
jgi:hypothetical protein